MKPNFCRFLVVILVFWAGPAWAGDLTGAWRVTGKLPDGPSFTGVAALTGDDSEYTIRGSSKVNGRYVRWEATGIRDGDDVEFTFVSGKGFVGKIQDFGSVIGTVGSLTIDEDEQSIAGPLESTEGSESGNIAFELAEYPEVVFEEERVTVHVGGKASVTATSSPSSHLALIWFEGPAVRRATWTSGGRKVHVVGREAGSSRVYAHLGGPEGPVLDSFRVNVDSGSDLLSEILDDVEDRADEAPIVIFDLDDTLFDTRYRVKEILRAYGEKQDLPRLVNLDVENIGYTIEDTLRWGGFSSKEARGPIGRGIKRYYRNEFFSGNYFQFDQPIPGCLDYILELQEAGARVVYITGRPTSARQGSLDSLRQHGYPTKGINFFLKPETPKVPTAVFKERIARDIIGPMGPVAGAFDNEPGNCNAFLRAHPNARVVFVDTLHKPSAPDLLPGIEAIPDFE